MTDFEPKKLFLGVIDLFSILLPGALLTYLLRDWLGPLVLGTEGYLALNGAAAWLVFFFGAYLLGHFAFLVGAWLLDDRLYDRLRAATWRRQVDRLAEGKELAPAWRRRLAGWLFKADADAAVGRAVAVKEHYLAPLGAASAVNAFQWCKARLALESPEALAAVQRFEADSKFFRSLVVVLAVVVLWGLAARPALALLALLLLLPTVWRYVDQRAKATSQAYWYILALEARDGGFRQPPPRPEAPTHAGGVVYRTRGRRIEYLLVRASRAPNEWVLPKGHVEVGETTAQAAVREVLEEGGAWARVESELDDVDLVVRGAPIRIRFYLMEWLAQGPPGEAVRKPTWLPLDEAVARATHAESREMLLLAESRAAPGRLPAPTQPLVPAQSPEKS